jgi:acyl-CoA reductase-like NAD-dependent aldehyde dehydrogenase
MKFGGFGGMKNYGLYVGGDWVKTKEKFDVLDRYTGEPFVTISQASKEHVDLAVQSARRSFNEVKLSPYERYEVLFKLSQLVRENTETLAETLVREVGKPIKEARLEVKGVAGNYEVLAEEAKRITGEMVPIDANPGSEKRIAFTLRVPAGIVCAIAPFNYPLSLMTSKVGAAIAAGNTVILKPTQQSPVSACQLMELLLEAGLPPEHAQLVLGSGSTAGEWLLQNQDINFYSLTGSTEVGDHITRTIGLRRCAMELGSNAAVIVHKDADVKKAATACAQRGFYHAGQVCISIQRIYVHKDIEEEFIGEATRYAESLVLGNPMEETTTLGPMISEKEVQRVAEWVDEAVKQGAKVIIGGKPHGERFYLPTILTNTKPDMKVVCEEVFGPLVVIEPYEDFDDAIKATNDSKYGLQAGVFTQDIGLAMKAAKEIECGGVMINDTAYYKVRNMPYGGMKHSGFGKEGGKYAIREMTEEKIIVLNL